MDAKVRLRRELAESRLRLGEEVAELEYRLNVVRIVKESWATHPWVWRGGMIVGGWVVSRMLSSIFGSHAPKIVQMPKEDIRLEPEKKSSFLKTATKLSFTLALPFLKRYITQKIEERMSSNQSTDR